MITTRLIVETILEGALASAVAGFVFFWLTMRYAPVIEDEQDDMAVPAWIGQRKIVEEAEPTTYCGECGEECEYEWETEDASFDHAFGVEQVIGLVGVHSECCDGPVFSDRALTIEFVPDPDTYEPPDDEPYYDEVD